MDVTRRTFFRISLGLASAVYDPWTMHAQGRSPGGVHPPDPAEPPGTILQPTNSPRLGFANLRDRAAEFRSSLSQLCQLAEALRKEVGGGLELTQVFSVKVYKETQSLEKLGKKLKTLSKL